MNQPNFVVVRSPDAYERCYSTETRVAAEAVADYIDWLHRDEPSTSVQVFVFPDDGYGVRVSDDTGTFFLGK